MNSYMQQKLGVKNGPLYALVQHMLTKPIHVAQLFQMCILCTVTIMSAAGVRGSRLGLLTFSHTKALPTHMLSGGIPSLLPILMRTMFGCVKIRITY